MATAPPRACKCGQRVESGQRCPRCTPQQRRQSDERRGTSHERGYDATWRRLRDLVLNEEPLCRECERNGKLTAAVEVDHIIPHSGYGDPKRLDRSNLQPLCTPCHSRKTARENGGFGNRRSMESTR